MIPHNQESETMELTAEEEKYHFWVVTIQKEVKNGARFMELFHSSKRKELNYGDIQKIKGHHKVSSPDNSVLIACIYLGYQTQAEFYDGYDISDPSVPPIKKA